MHCFVCCSGHPSPLRLRLRLPHRLEQQDPNFHAWLLLIVLFIYANKDPNSVQVKRRIVPTILRLRGFTQHDIYNPCFWIHCSFCPIVLLGTLHIAAAAASALLGPARTETGTLQCRHLGPSNGGLRCVDRISAALRKLLWTVSPNNQS